VSPYVESALIGAAALLVSATLSLTGVLLTIRSQNRKQAERIDADNKAALAEQTGQIKEHLKGGPS